MKNFTIILMALMFSVFREGYGSSNYNGRPKSAKPRQVFITPAEVESQLKQNPHKKHPKSGYDADCDSPAPPPTRKGTLNDSSSDDAPLITKK